MDYEAKALLKELDELRASMPEDEFRRLVIFNVNPFEQLVRLVRDCERFEAVINERLANPTPPEVRQELSDIKERFASVRESFRRDWHSLLQQCYPGSN